MKKELIYKLPILFQLLFRKIAISCKLLGGDSKVPIDKTIILFKNEKECDKKYLKALKRDIKKSYIKYLAKPIEYFLFGFEHKTTSQRREYLTDIQKDMYCEKYDGIANFKILNDKFLFYEKMKAFYHRDACLIRKSTDESLFLSFVSRHPTFIVKPNIGSFGRNTKILNVEDTNSANALFNDLLKAGQWIVEEIIYQVPEMAKFNSTSVNTVRIPTFMCHGKVVVYGTFMRTGRNGSVVDNAGLGGIFLRIDEKTGVCTSDGYTEDGVRYKKHPDSGVEFKGFSVPKWQEVLELAKECHKILEEHKYVGWDFALTEKGWVLIEGNWGQFLCQQVAGGKPMKKGFVSLMSCDL